MTDPPDYIKAHIKWMEERNKVLQQQVEFMRDSNKRMNELIHLLEKARGKCPLCYKTGHDARHCPAQQ